MNSEEVSHRRAAEDCAARWSILCEIHVLHHDLAASINVISINARDMGRVFLSDSEIAWQACRSLLDRSRLLRCRQLYHLCRNKRAAARDLSLSLACLRTPYHPNRKCHRRIPRAVEQGWWWEEEDVPPIPGPLRSRLRTSRKAAEICLRQGQRFHLLKDPGRLRQKIHQQYNSRWCPHCKCPQLLLKSNYYQRSSALSFVELRCHSLIGLKLPFCWSTLVKYRNVMIPSG